MPCLRMIFEVAREFLVEEDHGFAVHHSVLRASERKHIHAHVGGDLFQTCVQAHRGVGEASAIDVKQHVVVVSETRE